MRDGPCIRRRITRLDLGTLLPPRNHICSRSNGLRVHSDQFAIRHRAELTEKFGVAVKQYLPRSPCPFGACDEWPDFPVDAKQSSRFCGLACSERILIAVGVDTEDNALQALKADVRVVSSSKFLIVVESADKTRARGLSMNVAHHRQVVYVVRCRRIRSPTFLNAEPAAASYIIRSSLLSMRRITTMACLSVLPLTMI